MVVEFEHKAAWAEMMYFTDNMDFNARTCLRGFANNKGADQPVCQRSLISPFVILLLEGMISRLATSKIAIF